MIGGTPGRVARFGNSVLVCWPLRSPLFLVDRRFHLGRDLGGDGLHPVIFPAALGNFRHDLVLVCTARNQGTLQSNRR
jgi:hypothetical protein